MKIIQKNWYKIPTLLEYFDENRIARVKSEQKRYGTHVVFKNAGKGQHSEKDGVKHNSLCFPIIETPRYAQYSRVIIWPASLAAEN